MSDPWLPSAPPPPSTPPAAPPAPRPDMALQTTPNAERYVLEADAMRRRQLRSALLHGSARNWRESRRIWPAVVVGLVVVAVILAGLSVMQALKVSLKNNPPAPGPTAPASSPAVPTAPTAPTLPTSPASSGS